MLFFHFKENGWSAEKMFEMNEKKVIWAGGLGLLDDWSFNEGFISLFQYGVKSTYNEKMEEYT